VLQLLLFVFPVRYFSEQVYASTAEKSPWLYTAFHLNPVAMLCTTYRKILVAPQDPIFGDKKLPYLPLDWTLVSITALLSLAIFVGGYAFFNRVKWGFVERP